MTRSEIFAVLDLHAAWLRGEAAGARAHLEGAYLEGAYLGGANLVGANLGGANLVGANLVGANLVGADLRSADLRSANLRSANLRSADLRSANLRSADLGGTCLDPTATPPTISDAEIVAAGLELDGPWVLGWRTARSMHVGSAEYAPGSTHVAPWFSVDASTSCHPGIYFASRAWLDDEFGTRCAVVRCRALRAELVHAGDKWRARRLWIQCADGSWPEVTP